MNFKYWLYPENPNRLAEPQKVAFTATGEVPIKLIIESSFQKKKRKMIKTGFNCSKELLYTLFPEYTKTKVVTVDTKLQQQHQLLQQHLRNFVKPYADAINIINAEGSNTKVYTFKQLDEFIRTNSEKVRITKQLGEEHKLIEVLDLFNNNDNKQKTKDSYKDGIRNFIKFSDNEDLTIYDIDYNFMVKWDKWAKEKLVTKTMESYCNSLLSVLRFSARVFPEYSLHNIPLAKNPKLTIENLGLYGENQIKIYKIPVATKGSRSFNKYLSQEQIELFKKYSPDNDKEQTAKDMWFLMYYLAGCYPIDLVEMFKKSDYNEKSKSLEYKRSKTDGRTSIEVKVPITVVPELKKLIDIYRSTDKTSTNLFRFKETARKPENEKNNLPDRNNTWLNVISKKMGFEKLNCEMARHSCFNMLLKKNESFEKIMTIAGHTDFRTTRNYLDTLKQVDYSETYDKL